MILRNFAKIAAVLTDTQSTYLVNIGLVDGTNQLAEWYSTYTYTKPSIRGITLDKNTDHGDKLFQAHYWYICLGSGTTPPTIDDYCLESVITNKDSITYSTSNISCQRTDTKIIYSATINNTCSEDIVFTEVMLTDKYDANASGTPCTFALTRDVISPVTIPAGGSKTIAIVIDFAAMATSVA